jgi:competence protein ComEC
LKIAHHGSKYSTSEEFLQAVNPKTAVIGVGENSYGHPTAEVLQRLEKFGIQVLRTDTNGTVKFVSDGNDIKLIN